jgi:hypothetical protein
MRRTPALLAATFVAVVAMVVFGAIGVAVAHDSGGSHDTGPQLVETHLRLAADQHRVVLGGSVTLTGRLTAEASETADKDDGDEDAAEVESEFDDDHKDVTAPADGAVMACREGSEGQHGGLDGGRADSDDETPTPIAGAEVAIYQSTGEHLWSLVATVTTDADGQFSVVQTPTTDTRFRAVFAGDDVYEKARSHKVKVEVVASVTPPSVSGSSPTANTGFVVGGKATKGAGAVTVSVFKRVSGGRLVKVASARASASAGFYRARLKLRAGTYEIAASQSGNAQVHGARSKHRKLKVAARH